QSIDARSSHPNQNFFPANTASQRRLPGPSSVPAFGEAVFRQTNKQTQQQNSPHPRFFLNFVENPGK
ncbi:hypothetical protein, partial [Paracoccus sediminilitoris]|uniref:hypothetical protein n=1 Tax=Paracoccus sediminilitoris TaxID=2202419 RepID=UPI00272B1A75